MDHVNPAEYAKVVNRMKDLGISRGFIQGIESADHYRPDFDEEHPFE
jgi:hypothetical protein